MRIYIVWLSHLRPCQEPNPELRVGRPEYYNSVTVPHPPQRWPISHATLWYSSKMSVDLHSPYIAISNQKMTKSQLYTLHIPHSVNVSRYTVHACIHLRMLMVGLSDAEIKKKNFFNFYGALGQWATDLKICKQITGSDPRTGTFYQMWPSIGGYRL